MGFLVVTTGLFLWAMIRGSVRKWSEVGLPAVMSVVFTDNSQRGRSTLNFNSNNSGGSSAYSPVEGR